MLDTHSHAGTCSAKAVQAEHNFHYEADESRMLLLDLQRINSYRARYSAFLEGCQEGPATMGLLGYIRGI